jgi:hypothetical protein
MKQMTRVVATPNKQPYFEWECFKNGMYKNYSEIDNYNQLYNYSKELLSNQSLFLDNGILMVNEWIVSCNTFLNNHHINKIAFIGQATCCYKYKVPEIITKDVWKCLDFKIQNEANLTAKKILNYYETKYKRLHKKMEEIWV